MKLSKTQISTLIEVLNGQSGVKPIEDKEAYAEKLAMVSEFLNTKNGKATGGITSEVYKDNKEVKELLHAAKAHLDKAKARAEKKRKEKEADERQKLAANKLFENLGAAASASQPNPTAPPNAAMIAPKTQKTAKSKDAKSPKMASPDEEKARAAAIVSFINAVTGVKKLDAAQYSNAYNRSKKYLDFKKGGILDTAPAGKTSPWERFKDFPGVKEAAKAHRTYVKNKVKTTPEQDMA